MRWDLEGKGQGKCVRGVVGAQGLGVHPEGQGAVEGVGGAKIGLVSGSAALTATWGQTGGRQGGGGGGSLGWPPWGQWRARQ